MLDILYDSGPCLVVNKPAGMLTQAPAGIDSLEVQVKAFYREREQKEGNIYLGLPHRLDRPVSGAIVFARHVRAAQRLSTQFENRTVTKVYWAVVEGDVAARRRHVDRPPAQAARHGAVDRRAGGRPARQACGHALSRAGRGHIAEPSRLGVPSQRRFVTPGPDGRAIYTWLEVELETGRTHQIRVQSASRGHAVIGDSQYGSTQPFGEQFDDERLRGDRAARAAARLQSPDDERAGGRDRPAAAGVGAVGFASPIITSGKIGGSSRSFNLSMRRCSRRCKLRSSIVLPMTRITSTSQLLPSINRHNAAKKNRQVQHHDAGVRLNHQQWHQRPAVLAVPEIVYEERPQMTCGECQHGPPQVFTAKHFIDVEQLVERIKSKCARPEQDEHKNAVHETKQAVVKR